ncbi:hypothetical protein LCGC14_2259640 [marine sediment metagenome]|uniref:Uncharacterized protein n=1 Tax=marine sediment metagenome TaxID=412755 RepID=A0A0F9DMH6_9ZZZZ
MTRRNRRIVLILAMFGLTLLAEVYVQRPVYIETSWDRIAYPTILFGLNPLVLALAGWLAGRYRLCVWVGPCVALIVGSWFVGIPVQAFFRYGRASFVAHLRGSLAPSTLCYAVVMGMGCVICFCVGKWIRVRMERQSGEQGDSSS